MRAFLLRLFVAGPFIVSANAIAADCEKLLVPDFALPRLDTTTDLAYLAAITPENFTLHKTNAVPKLAHPGVLLPIASDSLQHAKDYSEFDEARAQKYAELRFDYPLADLAAYYRRLLPTERLNTYNACAGAIGFVAQVVNADQDFVEVLASWRATAAGPAQVPIANITVTGATLIGGAPSTLQTPPVPLIFLRNLGADLRLSGTVAALPVAVWVPRFLEGATLPEPVEAPCADAGKVVRALFRQTLGREPKPSELTAQKALLTNGGNSVRQLAERAVLSEEYQKKFAKDKELEETLQGLYTHVLARAGDAKGLANNKAQFRGAPFAHIVMRFFRTAEYQRSFGEWSVPGAPPLARYCPAPK